MKILKFTLFLLIIVSFSFKANAQKPSKSAAADTAYNLQQYHQAIDLYKEAYDAIKRNKAEKARIKFQVAMCFRNLSDPKLAEQWFAQVVKINYENPVSILYYADALRANEKYSEAIAQYTVYKEKVPSDPKGQQGILSCQMSQKWKETPTRYIVDNAKEFNSKFYDFAPCYSDKKFSSLIFTSTRESSTGNETDPNLGQSYSDLYWVTKDKKGKWSSPIPLPEPINTSASEGTSCMNSIMNTLYFTRCGVKKKSIEGCNIYYITKQGPGWDIPQLVKLTDDTITRGLTFGYPTISKDELSLYFSSNIPGGRGEHDIWVAKRKSKNQPFGKPENLGSVINTAGDEIAPYIAEDGTLYFASDGLVGMGGLDIFKATPKQGGGFNEPENLKYPINSPYDDFAIIFEGNSDRKGFLTSNRPGGKGLDDIYRFELPSLLFTLKGVVTDDSTKQVLKGALVVCKGSDGSMYVDTTDATGLFHFDNSKGIAKIQENTSYVLTVTPGKHTKTHMICPKSTGQVTTVGLTKNTDLRYDLALTPIPKVIVLREIRYAYDKWDLLPQYQDSLNDVEKTLKENENIVVEISSHTDARGKDAHNDPLSQKRAESVVNYLISKGIAPDRMVAKGCGKRIPRTLTRDYVVNDTTAGSDKKYLFTKGTKITEKFIKGLKYKGEQEAAHQLNRRTEMRILRTDYVPKGGSQIFAPIKIAIDTTSEDKSPFENLKNQAPAQPKPAQPTQQPGQPTQQQQPAQQPNKDAVKPEEKKK